MFTNRNLKVCWEGWDDLLCHLVDAGEAEAGLNEGGVRGEPVPHRRQGAEEGPPPPRERLPLIGVDLGEK